MVAPRTQPRPETEVCDCASCQFAAAMNAIFAQYEARQKQIRRRFFVQLAGIGAVVLTITILSVLGLIG